MGSANFVVGFSLDLAPFRKYVLPLFAKENYAVPDVQGIKLDSLSRVLVSVVGEGDLEKGVSDILLKAGNDAGYDGKNGLYHHMFFSGDDACYEVLGIYADNNTASQLFPVIAKQYLLDELSIKVDELQESIKDLFDKKLSEL